MTLLTPIPGSLVASAIAAGSDPRLFLKLGAQGSPHNFQSDLRRQHSAGVYGLAQPQRVIDDAL
jgi:hypothetical protein